MYVRHLLNLTRVKTLVLWSRRLTSKQLQEKTHELLSLKKKLGIKNPWELSLSYSELQNLEFSSLPAKSVFIPRPRTEAAKRAFSFRGAVMWNGLQNVLKDSFKSALSLP